MPVSTPLPWPETPETHVTAEAGISLDPHTDLRVEALAAAGDRVAQGMPLLRDRRHPEYVVTAPMAGTVAELQIGAGRRLSSLVIHRDDAAGVHQYDTRAARAELEAEGSSELRGLLQASGLWMRLRLRPFGRVPPPDAAPNAILVTAVDTRPLAPDPRLSIADFLADWRLGLRVVKRLSGGTAYVLQDDGPDLTEPELGIGIIRAG